MDYDGAIDDSADEVIEKLLDALKGELPRYM